MKTIRLQTTPQNIYQAAQLLKRGDVVAFPTDTVYGVGADVWNADAIAKLYAAKQRPAEKGLPLLISDIDALEQLLAGPVPDAVLPLLEAHWPGALTVILSRSQQLPSNLSANDGVAVRLPDHAITRTLIRQAGGAIASSSANLSGRPAATSAELAYKQLNTRVAAIIDGGPATAGMASTVLDCTTRPYRILRQGPVHIQNALQLEALC